MTKSPRTLPMVSLSDLQSVVKAVKANIDDECRADEFDTIPGILLTVACDAAGNWEYQTGSTEYSGPIYSLPHWASVAVYRRSNTRELARILRDDLKEAVAAEALNTAAA